MSQLNGGLTQQRRLILEGENAVEEQRSGWLRAKRRVDILSKTIERLMREETEKDNRKEQALADELAQRKFHRS